MSNRLRALTLGVGLASLAATPARADGKVEPIGAFPASAPAAITDALESAGYRIGLGDGSVAGEIWLRKDAPGLVPSAFVGVLILPKQTTDFRGQAVKPGTYTLRYAQMPGDGNHLGTAPTTDFLLLSPVADDADPAAQPDFAALTKTSAKTAGLNHPSPLNLAAVGERKDFPGVATNEYGHEVFYVKLKTAKGEQPLAIVVKGQTDH